jgi:hypothetical protein
VRTFVEVGWLLALFGHPEPVEAEVLGAIARTG